jgi:hypothetical protein
MPSVGGEDRDIAALPDDGGEPRSWGGKLPVAKHAGRRRANHLFDARDDIRDTPCGDALHSNRSLSRPDPWGFRGCLYSLGIDVSLPNVARAAPGAAPALGFVVRRALMLSEKGRGGR